MKNKTLIFSVLFLGMLSVLLTSCKKDSALLTITLKPATEITGTTAISGGIITTNESIMQLSCGVCWSTSQNPTVTDNKINYYPASPNFSALMMGLMPKVTYFFRAYVTNSAGTTYSEQSSFTTLATLPFINTANLANVTDNAATGGGNIENDGGAEITARGVCWSTNQNATIADQKTNNGTGSGSFASNITGLTAGTIYFVRAYATNSVGTSYGNEVYIHYTPPSITTLQFTMVQPSSGRCTYNVLNDGGSPITENGLCWSKDYIPTIENNKSIGGSGLGSFWAGWSNSFMKGGVYLMRAYATNSYGTFYGNTITVYYNWTDPGSPSYGFLLKEY